MWAVTDTYYLVMTLLDKVIGLIFGPKLPLNTIFWDLTEVSLCTKVTEGRNARKFPRGWVLIRVCMKNQTAEMSTNFSLCCEGGKRECSNASPVAVVEI